MSSQPLLSRVEIPEAEVRAALDSVAYPGFTGSVYVEIGLIPQAAQCVQIAVLRRQSKSANSEGPIKQVLPDPERKKPVESCLADIRSKLCITPTLKAVECHLVNGVLQKWTVLE